MRTLQAHLQVDTCACWSEHIQCYRVQLVFPYCPICIYLEEVLADLVTIERTQGVAVRRNIDFKFNQGEAWRGLHHQTAEQLLKKERFPTLSKTPVHAG